MSFEENIQQWVALDNQMKLLNEKIKEIREKKSRLYDKMTPYIEQHNLNNASVQISDGKLRFVNTKVYVPLSFRYIEKSLGEVIRNEGQVKQIVNYLKDQREVKVVPEIKRFQNA
jgi:hypothetical protein